MNCEHGNLSSYYGGLAKTTALPLKRFAVYFAVYKDKLLYYSVKISWVAQPAERVAVNHLVGGSNPSPGAIFSLRTK